MLVSVFPGSLTAGVARDVFPFGLQRRIGPAQGDGHLHRTRLYVQCCSHMIAVREVQKLLEKHEIFGCRSRLGLQAAWRLLTGQVPYVES